MDTLLASIAGGLAALVLLCSFVTVVADDADLGFGSILAAAVLIIGGGVIVGFNADVDNHGRLIGQLIFGGVVTYVLGFFATGVILGTSQPREAFIDQDPSETDPHKPKC